MPHRRPVARQKEPAPSVARDGARTRSTVAPLTAVTTLSALTALGLCGGCEREVALPDGLTWGEPPRLAAADQARLVITNNGDDTLTMVPLATAPAGLATSWTGNVGNNPFELEGPHHLAASPDGRFIYFNLSNYVISGGGSGPHGAHGTGSVPGYLVKLDARTMRKLGQVLIDRSPGDVILSRDGELAYVSHYDITKLTAQQSKGRPEAESYSAVAIVRTADMQLVSLVPICATAHGQALSPDGKTLYVTCSQSDELALVDVADPKSPKVTRRVKVADNAGTLGMPRYVPYAVAVYEGSPAGEADPLHGTAWISNNSTGDVRVFNPKLGSGGEMDPALNFTVGGIAMFGDFSHDRRFYYVPHQTDEQVTEIDTKLRTMRHLQLPKAQCSKAHALRVTPAGDEAFVVCEGNHVTEPGTLLRLNLARFALVDTLKLGLFPDGLTPLPVAPP